MRIFSFLFDTLGFFRSCSDIYFIHAAVFFVFTKFVYVGVMDIGGSLGFNAAHILRVRVRVCVYKYNICSWMIGTMFSNAKANYQV